MRFKFRSVFIALGIASGGCALHEVAPKPPDLPAAFEARPIEDQQPWPSQEWYKGFGSAELQALIDQAASSNLDLTMARARVKQAAARARQARASILPSVDANGQANYLSGHSVEGTAHETDWSALLTATYEVDFWGKNRATARSASLLAESSKADRDTIALTTLAGVANGYFQVLSLNDRLASSAANVDAALKLLEVIQARYDAGFSNPVDLATQKAIAATAALVIPELKQQRAEALAALAILLGRAPEGFSVQGETLDSLSEPHVGSGLPSELLTRRPDLFMAEANMRAANADLLVARAALFPALTLTASGGLQNPALNAAVISLSGAGPTLNLGAALAQPIFNGGRLRAARSEAEAKEEELVAAYRAAILSALVDVENALSALSHLDDARALQEENLAQSARAFEGASIRYKAGSGDFLALLESQRTLYTAREQYSQYKLARFQSLVGLCKALGGGWQVQAPVPSNKENR